MPDRVLRAIQRPTIDHRGPEFAALLGGIRERLGRVFQTRHPVALYPSSGTGMWEAALVNTLSPGDRVLMVETGYFAALWRDVAAGVGLEVEWLPGDWRRGADAGEIEERLNADSDRSIKAVAIVHNETSTGATSDLAAIREAIDRAGHPALLLADTISSLGSIDYRHDEWEVDVGVCCSQKGLMLPPGLGLLALSPKALAAGQEAGCPRSYWDWRPVLQAHERGFFPYTPPTNLLYGLDEALDMLLEEGLDEVLARHRLFAAATRRAVEEWGLEICCVVAEERSDSLTAVVLPEGHDADALRKIILERFDMSLGTGLGRLAGRVFRIGHLGAMNELMLAGTLSGVEMGLALAGVPHRKGGAGAALEVLIGS